eukprot:CAMPEP_0182517936 /NCGR_PEP_ID=MMETSP1321-20130603/43208_1 /TAXON_ID=91990 /ORGANISM="Bolidomonas sp., Strain RCC1657" /LENGTH=144 /DNA_ID=CAMNT_0024725723 /DNA_START=780 /DNA_END=1214 /DNA_ORIENTATION=-
MRRKRRQPHPNRRVRSQGEQRELLGGSVPDLNRRNDGNALFTYEEFYCVNLDAVTVMGYDLFTHAIQLLPNFSDPNFGLLQLRLVFFYLVFELTVSQLLKRLGNPHFGLLELPADLVFEVTLRVDGDVGGVGGRCGNVVGGVVG